MLGFFIFVCIVFGVALFYLELEAQRQREAQRQKEAQERGIMIQGIT